jgi:hypothetical protein
MLYVLVSVAPKPGERFRRLNDHMRRAGFTRLQRPFSTWYFTLEESEVEADRWRGIFKHIMDHVCAISGVDRTRCTVMLARLFDPKDPSAPAFPRAPRVERRPPVPFLAHPSRPMRSVQVYFDDSFEDRPAVRDQIRAALNAASGPGDRSPLDMPVWIVVCDRVEGQAVYVAHHTTSQFTITAQSPQGLCDEVGTAMRDDTRYRSTDFRLDGRPDRRADHGPDPDPEVESRSSDVGSSAPDAAELSDAVRASESSEHDDTA